MTESCNDQVFREGLSRDDAIALRESLNADECERIERTTAALLDRLEKAYSRMVLSEFAFADGPLRFGDLKGGPDVLPNTLSARLSDLTVAGLLNCTTYDEVPSRVEYAPTPRAESLFPVFTHLHHWAIRYAI
jgi:DNA-binding HxlR family transcriptional regulator